MADSQNPEPRKSASGKLPAQANVAPSDRDYTAPAEAPAPATQPPTAPADDYKKIEAAAASKFNQLAKIEVEAGYLHTKADGIETVLSRLEAAQTKFDTTLAAYGANVNSLLTAQARYEEAYWKGQDRLNASLTLLSEATEAYNTLLSAIDLKTKDVPEISEKVTRMDGALGAMIKALLRE